MVAEAFPVDSLGQKALTQVNRDYLQQEGLPDFCAPHLYFGPFGGIYLPPLPEWPWAADWKGWQASVLCAPQAYVLGAAQHEEAIVLIPNDSGVYLFSESGTDYRMLNSNVDCLAKAIFAFAEMAEAAWRHDENAVPERRIPQALVTAFSDKIREIEPRIPIADSLWVQWASDKSSNNRSCSTGASQDH
ncbi:SUKH-4 family immunity protein [Curvibacter sp. APW13]|uniref:SUKH-4 family immunity protein n=1 Tax=Curvibacter sp. APW13 TaxID=3077236 RepID=UPI0028DE6AB2|nr:SUKH-4 family immunity protein [Curvibacter sp. APW13]MDT8991458.1 SUKH-4 family immunity protein [Curvibacter sp. APW13]